MAWNSEMRTWPATSGLPVTQSQVERGPSCWFPRYADAPVH
jgi:hypothetical protein